MKPRKQVILLVRDEASLSRWRFLIETRGHYEVLGTTDLCEAIQLVRNTATCQVVVTDIPGELGADALAAVMRGPLRSVLLFGVPKTPEQTLADRVEVSASHLAGLQARVMEALADLTRVKRGPKLRPRDPRCEAEPTVRTLVEERDVGTARSCAA